MSEKKTERSITTRIGKPLAVERANNATVCHSHSKSPATVRCSVLKSAILDPKVHNLAKEVLLRGAAARRYQYTLEYVKSSPLSSYVVIVVVVDGIQAVAWPCDAMVEDLGSQMVAGVSARQRWYC